MTRSCIFVYSCRYPSFIQVFCYGYLNTKDFFQRDIIHVHVHILGYLNIVNVLVFNYIIFFYSLFVLSVKDLQVMSLKATRIFAIFTWIRILKCNNSFFFKYLKFLQFENFKTAYKLLIWHSFIHVHWYLKVPHPPRTLKINNMHCIHSIFKMFNISWRFEF